jgi:opacity protein-like surface antigen
MNATKIVSILLVACAAASAQARDVAATADLGTTGLGLHLTTPLAAKLNGRIGVNVANTSYEGSTSDMDYDFKLKLKTIDVLLDYHPFDSAFRVTGGVVYNGNKIDARAKPSGGTYTINNVAYNAATVGDLSSKIDFRKAAPYLGIGWGNAVKQAGWSFGTDLGIMFQGTPKTQLASNNCTALPILCSRLASDVAAENVKLGEEVKDFKLYPVIRVGLSYRF